MIPLWMTTNSGRKVSRVKCYEEVKIKSGVKGNNSAAWNSADFAPIGTSVKQMSLTVTRTDVCYDYNFNLRTYTFLFQSRAPTNLTTDRALLVVYSVTKKALLFMSMGLVNPSLPKNNSRNSQPVQRSHTLVVHTYAPVWLHWIVKRFELKCFEFSF